MQDGLRYYSSPFRPSPLCSLSPPLSLLLFADDKRRIYCTLVALSSTFPLPFLSLFLPSFFFFELMGRHCFAVLLSFLFFFSPLLFLLLSSALALPFLKEHQHSSAEETIIPSISSFLLLYILSSLPSPSPLPPLSLPSPSISPLSPL